MRFGYKNERFAPNVLTYHDNCVIIAIIGRIISAGLAVLVFIAAVLTVFPAVRVFADMTENRTDYAAEMFRIIL